MSSNTDYLFGMLLEPAKFHPNLRKIQAGSPELKKIITPS